MNNGRDYDILEVLNFQRILDDFMTSAFVDISRDEDILLKE